MPNVRFSEVFAELQHEIEVMTDVCEISVLALICCAKSMASAGGAVMWLFSQGIDTQYIKSASFWRSSSAIVLISV